MGELGGAGGESTPIPNRNRYPNAHSDIFQSEMTLTKDPRHEDGIMRFLVSLVP
jgi:hypothetical protein